jgi:outer membrane protein assembly factor BamB
MKYRILACTLLATLLVASGHAGENWPGWRGPTGDGQSDEKNLPLTWGGKTQENVLWKAPLLPDKAKPDQNQSSPIVWRQRVFVTVSYWPDGTDGKDYPEHHLLCFDAKTGNNLWDTIIPPGPWKLKDLRGGYTAPTPATDGNYVYASFGSAVLAAVDFQGKVAWRKEIKPHAFDVAWGASPVLFDGSVIVVCDQQANASTIYAFDGKTGEVRWERKRPKISWSHSTPLLAKVGAKMQLLTATHNGPQGLDPGTGEVLWSFTDSKQIGDTVTPTYRDGLLYIDSGRGSIGVCIDATGSGDVSKTPLKWKVAIGGEGFSSPVLVGDNLYRLASGGSLACWRWTSGELVFKERLEGAEHAVSPFASADGRIYFAGANKTYVLKAGPKLEVLAVNTLGDGSRASPAVAAGRIYLKGSRFLWCIGKH